MARARRKSPPPTVSRAALLSRGSDAEFRGLIHDLIAYGHKLDACRDAFATIAGISGVQYEIVMLVSRAEGLSIDWVDDARGRGLVIEKDADVRAVLEEALAIARAGQPVLVNAHLAKTEFRKGSISM